LPADEVMPFEHSLNAAVEWAYEKFGGLRGVSNREDLKFVMAECGITGLDNKAVVDAVLGRIRKDRKGGSG